MTGMDNLTLFAVGLVVTVPAAAVVIALVYAAGIDERAEKKRLKEETGDAAASGVGPQSPHMTSARGL